MIEARLVQVVVSGLTTGAIYSLMALGFHLVFVTGRTLDFAYGAIVALGGLVAFSLHVEWNIPLWVVCVAVPMLGGLLGYTLSGVVVWPLRDRPPGFVVIALLALGLVIENVAAIVWGKDPHPFPSFSGDRPIIVFGAAINPQSFWVLGLSIVALLASAVFLFRTHWGLVLRAAADDPVAARLMGIDVKAMCALAFSLSWALGMIGGTIMSPITFAGGYFALPLTIKGFTAAILGGIGRPVGSVAGGFLLGLVEAFVAGMVTTSYVGAIIMAALLLALLLRPQGLFAEAR